jgi:hypothetical protein
VTVYLEFRFKSWCGPLESHSRTSCTANGQVRHCNWCSTPGSIAEGSSLPFTDEEGNPTANPYPEMGGQECEYRDARGAECWSTQGLATLYDAGGVGLGSIRLNFLYGQSIMESNPLELSIATACGEGRPVAQSAMATVCMRRFALGNIEMQKQESSRRSSISPTELSKSKQRRLLIMAREVERASLP